jgi:hypothetical protein
VTDWTVGLVFGRDSAELGRLGHPPELEPKSSGGEAEPEPEANRTSTPAG